MNSFCVPGMRSVHILQHSGIIRRSLWAWLNIMWNRVDEDRIKLIGPDRACAEWLIRNGGKVTFSGESSTDDYNLLAALPNVVLKRLVEIECTNASVTHHGFEHLRGCKYIERIKFHKCPYVCNRALTQLLYVKDSLRGLHITSCDEVTDEGVLSLSQLRKKFKVDSPTDHKMIYEEMFKGGTYSDIRIEAFGHTWNLHKVYLKQCPYFAIMLSGDWREADQDEIKMEFNDPNITVDALDTVLGSLYLYHVELSVKKIVSILAAASHFRMDTLIHRCTRIMLKFINAKTALSYYEAGEMYGCAKLKSSAYTFLLNNVVNDRNHIIRHVSSELLADMVASPDLFVVNSERNVFSMLMRWLYFKHTQSESDVLCSDKFIKAYFASLAGATPFLETDSGARFAAPFSKMRLEHLFTHKSAVNSIIKAKVLPKQWINDAIFNSYLEILDVNEDSETLQFADVDSNLADLVSRGMRLAKYVKKDSSWRWHGLMAGLQLTFTVMGNTIKISHGRFRFNVLFNERWTRSLVLRVRVSAMNQPEPTRDLVEAKAIRLNIGQTVDILQIAEEKFNYPIIVRVELLFTKKTTDTDAAG